MSIEMLIQLGYGIVKVCSMIKAFREAINRSSSTIQVDNVSCLPHVLTDIASAPSWSSNVTNIHPTGAGAPVTN